MSLFVCFFFSSRRRHTRLQGDWSSDVCSSDLPFATREEWLKEYGDPGDTADDGAWLHDPAGNGPRLSLLRVPEPKTAKNRLHIDIRVAGPGSADERWARITQSAGRLTAAGATSLREYPGGHIVMADPEGNEFCVH